MYSQNVDTTNTKVIYPVGQISDTSYVRAVVVEKYDSPLIAKKYMVITEFWIFEESSKKQPTPFKQTVFDITGIIISNFKERVIWAIPSNKNE